MPLALLLHPLTEPGRLEIPPLAAAVTAALVVALVARFWPGPRRGSGTLAEIPEVHSWAGPVGPARSATRGVAVVLLLLAVLAGRLGAESELDNVAPALVVGLSWPLLLAASLLIGAVWRWLDPWDSVARVLRRGDEDRPEPRVGWAVVPAAAWAWYLGAYPGSLEPRSVGLALGAYSLLTIGGCLALGRQQWLSRAEVFGLLFGWAAVVRRGASGRWQPPLGAEVVLGVISGGLVFGSIRRSTLWGGLNVVPASLLLATVGLAVAAAAFAGGLWLAERRARALDAPGSVAAATVPALVAVAVALAMYSDVLFTSLSLLPELLADPSGAGWNIFPWRLPLLGLCAEGQYSCTPLVLTQTAVVLAGGVAGAVVLARRVEVRKRAPAMAGLCLVVAGGIVAVTAS